MGSIPALWRTWIESVWNLGTFPAQWTRSRFASVPSIVFMTDACSENLGPESAPSPIAAQGLTPASTDLWPLDGGAPICAAYVQVALTGKGSQVEVTLVNLGAMKDVDRTAQRVFVGLAYAWDGGTARPLALVYVFFTGQGSLPLPPPPCPPQRTP